MTQRIFFCLTQRIEPFFVWLKELNFFFEYDADNWTFFLLCRKKLSFFFWQKIDSKNWTILDNDLPQDDRKSALEVPIIEEFMRRAMCRLRWCPHNRNAADAMTKFKGAHSELSFTFLRTGMYTLKGEKTELADRAIQRQVGTVPRHKVSAVKSVMERVFFFVHMPLDWGDLFPGYMRAGPCRIWFLLHRQSFIHDVSFADPLGLRALCMCVLCSSLAPLLKKCVTAHQITVLSYVCR